MKRCMSVLLTLCLLVMPLCGTGLTVSAAAQTTYAVEALSFSAGYASTTDGEIDLNAVKSYDATDLHDLRYTDHATELASASGIPYQVFDIDLAGRTSGSVAVSYSGATKAGERIAVKAYNVKTKTWDTLGTFIGKGDVSASVDVATYNDNGRIHVAAVLDYVTNGSNQMIWSTDPQHYTEFEDLHEYYYTVYRYAAEQYKAGNVGYILTTGDLVDDTPDQSSAPHQWTVADQAMSYVEEVGMPNGLVTGNHDVGTFNALDYSAGPSTSNYSLFEKTFPASRYENERWYGGSLNNNASHYDLITVGNVDFLVMFLGYGVEATDETIVWANEVLRTYPHRTAIVATHQYLDAISAEYANRGQLIFNKIVDPNPNVKMVLCGHDDGSVCRETTASDGRIVYEILADYQELEVEDRSFYANEHYIGKVSGLSGDGYIRLLTVEGETLKSITYSPVTGRYNPFGVNENLTLDLDCGTPDRTMATVTFGAAVLGATTTATNVDRMTVTTDGSATTYSAITYASVPAAPAATDMTAWPQTTYGKAATPSEPYFAHAAKEAPLVPFKTDILQAVNLGEHPVVNGGVVNVGNYALGLKVDLNKTPYLYYSFAQPSDSAFTFAFINDTATAPWITFLDTRKGGTTMNYGSETWDAAAGAQYFTSSATGCIDMRTLLSVTDSHYWTVEQLNLYSSKGKDVVFSYLFFGAAPLDPIGSTYGEAATPAAPFVRNAAKEAPVVSEKVDLIRAIHLNQNAIIYGSVNYGNNALHLSVDLNKTPYLYYSFAQKANSRFTFALCNDTANSPWLTFLDSRQSGDTFNVGDDNWNAAGDAQFFTDSVTGCIDMRNYQYDKNIREWIVEQVNFYNPDKVPVMVNYLFFGSAAIGGKSTDTAALNALIAKANGLSTDGMTDASVKTFRSALSAATYVDRHDTAATARAYAALSDAMGALTPVKVTEVSTSNLVSVKNFHVSHSKWICGSTHTELNSSESYVSAKTVDGGMSLHRSSVSPHTYPNVLYNGTVTEFTVQPYGGIYLKLNMEARTGWAIAMQVVQDGKAAVRVRLNEGIVNSNYNLNADGYYGTYNDVYDVSEVFVRYGIDPTAPMTISGMSITTVGGGSGWNTFYHLELLTGKATSSNYYELEDLIAYAEQHTKSMYTSASWSTMQSALTKAKTAMSTAGLTQPQINMAVFRLKNALEALELAKFYEPHNSLLSNDISIWQNNGLAKATRNGDGDTVIENTNGSWSSADYIFPKTRRIRVATTQLELNMNVADATNLILLVDGEWVSISKYLTTNVNGEDVLAGDYNVKVPLSTIFKDKAAVDIGGVRVWSVGALGKNAVTIRKMTLDNLDTFTFDRTLTYGAAATPANPFMKHAAKNGPSVSHKVDVLAACGLDHPSMPGYESYGWQKLRLIVDLAKTPYLYYSIAQPANSKATFALTNENTYAPYFTFLDNNLGGSTMATSVDIWNAYTDDSQFVAGSVTGCIDMRTLLKDSSATTWQVNAMTLYSLAGANATMSYLYFGSAPLDDGYEEEPVAYEPGDFDMNDKVDTSDARQILAVIAINDLSNVSPVQIAAGDIDKDNRLSSSDVRWILEKSVLL